MEQTTEDAPKLGNGAKVVSISKRGKPKPLIRWADADTSKPEYGQVCVLKFYYLDWEDPDESNEDFCFGYLTKHNIWCDIDDVMMTEEHGVRIVQWAPLD